jgi:hypothetical protein
VAAAVGTKVLDITLGSALGSETAPYGDGHLVVEPDSSCFPCSSHDKCSHVSCGRRVTPQAITALTEWQLGLRPSVSPDDLTGCRVYRTCFSKNDGLLDLERLLSNEQLPRDQLNKLLRPNWLKVLSNQTVPPVCDLHISASLRDAARAARQVARMAQGTATQMARSAQGAATRRTTCENLGRLLREQEARLRRILSAESILNSLLMYGNIRRGSLNGSTLADQAVETAQIYAELRQLLSAFCWSSTHASQESSMVITHEGVS